MIEAHELSTPPKMIRDFDRKDPIFQNPLDQEQPSPGLYVICFGSIMAGIILPAAALGRMKYRMKKRAELNDLVDENAQRYFSDRVKRSNSQVARRLLSEDINDGVRINPNDPHNREYVRMLENPQGTPRSISKQPVDPVTTMARMRQRIQAQRKTIPDSPTFREEIVGGMRVLTDPQETLETIRGYLEQSDEDRLS